MLLFQSKSRLYYTTAELVKTLKGFFQYLRFRCLLVDFFFKCLKTTNNKNHIATLVNQQKRP